jgi:DNA-binding response OmpR family regulator
MENTKHATMRPRVLLAEDDFEMRRLVQEALVEDGFEVVTCSNGTDFLLAARSEWLAHRRPDLIVADVRMPGCSGIQAVADLQWLGWHAPTLVMTAFGDEGLHLQAEALGARVLDKPFDLESFHDAVRALAP